ncbi:MAG: aminotransferase class I/II-fold pyridoxal phosphate-dependent enzyme, partial [Acidimicrobiia bacterium]
MTNLGRVSRVRLRDDLSGLEGYHSPQIQVSVRLNTNESPYPPPPGFARAWADQLALLDLNRYPDRSSRQLRQGLGARLAQPAERFFCGNGSNEVIQTLLLAYGGPGRRALVFEPSYVLHAHIARLTGTEVVEAERPDGLAIGPEVAARVIAAERPDVVFLCSPNNPTGVVETRATVEAALGAGASLVVVDEAYAEFASWSALDLVDDEIPLVVVKTYSKVWALAALRLGFCVGPRWLVEDLEKVALPYHLPASTQLAGTLALGFVAEMEERVAAIVAERERLIRGLSAMEGFKVFPSGANFVLFRPPGDGHALWQRLLEQGVLVR